MLFKCYEPIDFPTPHDGSMLLCSLDLKESYWKLFVNSSVFDLQFKPVLGVINKDCIQAECLYSSQTECLARDTRHFNILYCKGTGASQLPHHQLPTQHYSQQLLLPYRSRARMNTHE